MFKRSKKRCLEGENFFKNIAYLMFSQGIIKILGLIYSLYLINKKYFGNEGNALFYSGYQFFVLLLTFSALGVPNAISNMIAKCKDESERKNILNVALCVYGGISIILGIILFFSADYISRRILKINVIKYSLQLYSVIIFLSTYESICIGYFNGIRKMNITGKIQVIEQVFKTISTIFFVECLSRISNEPEVLCIGAVMGIFASIFCGTIISAYYKNNEFGKKYKYKVRDNFYKISVQLLKLSFPISISAILISVCKILDSYTILNILTEKIGGESAHEMYGIFSSKVEMIMRLPLTFNICISTALIPNIAKFSEEKNKYKLKQSIKNSLIVSFIIGFSCVIFFSLFSKQIFNIFFSNNVNGFEYLKFSAGIVMFSVINQTGIGILQGRGKNNLCIIASFVFVALKMIGNFCGISILHKYDLATIIGNYFGEISMFLYLFLCNIKEFKKI